jgi:hypothetical protein
MGKVAGEMMFVLVETKDGHAAILIDDIRLITDTEHGCTIRYGYGDDATAITSREKAEDICNRMNELMRVQQESGILRARGIR